MPSWSLTLISVVLNLRHVGKLMISNPVTVTVGTFVRSFQYEGGLYPFHFSAKANGLSNRMDHNLLFFANNEAHALEVLERMFEFMAHCMIVKYDKAVTDHHPQIDAGSYERKALKYLDWLKELHAGKVFVERASNQQFYKVGWADNDTL